MRFISLICEKFFLTKRAHPSVDYHGLISNYLYRHQSIMSSYKKLTCKGTLRQVFICLRPPPLLWPHTPPPPHPLHTVHVYVYTQYTYSRTCSTRTIHVLAYLSGFTTLFSLYRNLYSMERIKAELYSGKIPDWPAPGNYQADQHQVITRLISTR